MQLSDIKSLMADDLTAIDNEIRHQLHSDVALIDQVSHYIINSGGKRLRPMLVVLGARAMGCDDAMPVKAAAIIEFIHTATLLHDDVVDESELRRGRRTAHEVWGNQASVLVGDFLYSRAFQMMVEIGHMRIMDILAEATNTIAEGEVLQLINVNDPDTTEEAYLQVIHRKTAKLFEAGLRIAAVLTRQDPQSETQMAQYGLHLGTAFQLIDDVLDYSGSSTKLGKHVGDDLAEGKPTLPLIYAMKNGTDAQKQLIQNAIEAGGLDQIDAVVTAIESTGALKYTEQFARRESDSALQALQALPASPYREALEALARLSVERNH
ncbi:MAG: octaprenyl diphosphate synthase [Gammaproteobacteria bacterium]|nr:octaprenyl diphosphate synthase [Gammaproteobacteria bacterium]